MSDIGEMQPYEAALITKSDELHSKKFARLSDAIVWLSGQFAAGDGNAEQGVVRYDGAVIWRKRNYPLTADESAPIAPIREAAEPQSALVSQHDEDLD